MNPTYHITLWDGGSVASSRSLSLASCWSLRSTPARQDPVLCFQGEWVMSGSEGRVRRERGEGWCWRIKEDQPSVCVSHQPRDGDVRFRRLWQAKKPHMLTFNVLKATIWKHLTRLPPPPPVSVLLDPWPWFNDFCGNRVCTVNHSRLQRAIQLAVGSVLEMTLRVETLGWVFEEDAKNKEGGIDDLWMWESVPTF